MRLALLISSPYTENTVVPERLAFSDSSLGLAESLARWLPDMTVRRLHANRELPEELDRLLVGQLEPIESLLVHFAGYVAVKSDRGPALLLDGSRLRAFPVSRLCAALLPAARSTFVLAEAVAVVDAAQTPQEVADEASRALVGNATSIAALCSVHRDPPPLRRGMLRLTDLFTLSLGHFAKRQNSQLVTAELLIEALRGERLAMSELDGLSHLPAHRPFILFGEHRPHRAIDELELVVPTLRGDELPLARETIPAPPTGFLGDTAYLPSMLPPRVSESPSEPRDTQPTLPEPAEADASTPLPAPVRPPDAIDQRISELLSRQKSGDMPAAISLSEQLLAELEVTSDPRRAQVGTALGEALARVGRNAEALFAFENALHVEPMLESAFEGACRLYKNESDYAGQVATIRRRLDRTTTPRQRIALLDRIADITLLELRDLEAGRAALEERWSLNLEDTSILERLIEVNDRLRAHERRLSLREALAERLTEDPAAQHRLWLEAARIAAVELSAKERAASALLRALSLGIEIDETLGTAASVLGPNHDPQLLLGLFESVLFDEREPSAAALAGQRLLELIDGEAGLLLEHLDARFLARLKELAEQYPSLLPALVRVLRAGEAEVGSLLTIQHARFIEPRDPALLRSLIDDPRADRDLVANGSAVLVALELFDKQDIERARELETSALLAPLRGLNQRDFEQVLFPVELKSELALSLSRVLPSLIAIPTLFPSPPKELAVIDPNTSTATLARCFLWASRFLGVPIPELSVSDQTSLSCSLCPGSPPRFIVERELMSGLSLPELAFIAAREVALLHSGFAARGDDSRPQALGSLLLTLRVATEPEPSALRILPDTEQRLARRLRASAETDPELALSLQQLGGLVPPHFEHCLVEATTFMMAVDCVRLRAGLLACGDPKVALGSTRRHPLASPLSPEQQEDVLLAFATSEPYLALRAALGLALVTAA